MRDKVLDTIEKYEMIGQGDHVCAAVSGGADSAALLAFLLSLREPMGLTVTACHLNHCLRGAEADRDEAFVRELCQRWQVPLTVERVEVAELARQEHLSEETAGRKARYALFERLHRETGCKVATAHTLSDNMETVLFSMARGTGLRGMCGIQPVRDYLIRPLIAVTRQEVEAYCAENGIGFVTDSTNFSEEYTRNRIRLRLIPELYALNPALPEAFAHLIEAMGEGYELVSREAKQFLDTAESFRGHTAYTAEAFLALPAAAASGSAQPYGSGRGRKPLPPADRDLYPAGSRGRRFGDRRRCALLQPGRPDLDGASGTAGSGLLFSGFSGSGGAVVFPPGRAESLSDSFEL